MGEEPKKQAWIRKLPGIGDFVERNLSLLEQLGLKQRLGALVTAGVYGASIWLWNNVPWYIAVAAFVLGTYCLLGVFHRIQLIRATAKLDHTAYRKAGAEMVEVSNSIFRFMADRQRDHIDQRKAQLPISDYEENDRALWQFDRDFESMTGRIFFERFGSTVLGQIAILSRLGVVIPNHMILLSKTKPEGLIQFLALMGDLLGKGYLEQAVDISKDENFMWHVVN